MDKIKESLFGIGLYIALFVFALSYKPIKNYLYTNGSQCVESLDKSITFYQAGKGCVKAIVGSK